MKKKHQPARAKRPPKPIPLFKTQAELIGIDQAFFKQIENSIPDAEIYFDRFFNRMPSGRGACEAARFSVWAYSSHIAEVMRARTDAGEHITTLNEAERDFRKSLGKLIKRAKLSKRSRLADRIEGNGDFYRWQYCSLYASIGFVLGLFALIKVRDEAFRQFHVGMS